MMTMLQIETELKKIQVMPPWGKKQNNEWDSLSNFVHSHPTYEEMLSELSRLNISEAFDNYTIHRWFNTLSASGVEQIFCGHKRVVPNPDKRHKLVDFTIDDISFDHKTSVFPKGFGKDIHYAKENKQELIKWLYEQQSTEGRFHLANRLFVVLHHSSGHHWQLRRELYAMKPAIDKYVLEFDSSKLIFVVLNSEQTISSDIIWFEQ